MQAIFGVLAGAGCWSQTVIRRTYQLPHALSEIKMISEPDLMLLNRRIGELKAVDALVGISLREPLLPLQRLQLHITPSTSKVIQQAHSSKTPLGVLGIDKNSADLMLSHGVEAHVADISTDGIATLVGGRVFEREGAAPCCSSHGRVLGHEDAVVDAPECFTSRVRWLDLGLSDELQAARSPSRAVSLVARELGPLVERWFELLARKYDDGDSAAARARAMLGDMPGIDRPSERALWVAALINPCGFGAPDTLRIRAAVLTSQTPLQRLAVAKTGLVDSLYKLKGGMWPMNTYYW